MNDLQFCNDGYYNNERKLNRKGKKVGVSTEKKHTQRGHGNPLPKHLKKNESAPYLVGNKANGHMSKYLSPIPSNNNLSHLSNSNNNSQLKSLPSYMDHGRAAPSNQRFLPEQSLGPKDRSQGRGSNPLGNNGSGIKSNLFNITEYSTEYKTNFQNPV